MTSLVRKFTSTIVTVVLLFIGASQAAASNLTYYTNGTIYDSDKNLTWLADAGASGLKTWYQAMTWVGGLTVTWVDSLAVTHNVTGWRLPSTLEGDLGCIYDRVARPDTGAMGAGCSGSEMGHLFYVEGIKVGNAAPFENLSSGLYWSGTTSTNTPGGAYAFEFASGGTTSDWYDPSLHPFYNYITTVQSYRALAVHEGNINSPVPEPETYAMMLAGLGLIGVIARRRRVK